MGHSKVWGSAGVSVGAFSQTTTQNKQPVLPLFTYIWLNLHTLHHFFVVCQIHKYVFKLASDTFHLSFVQFNIWLCLSKKGQTSFIQRMTLAGTLRSLRGYSCKKTCLVLFMVYRICL